MMKEFKAPVTIGEEVSVEFINNRYGNKPCTSINGMMAFINKEDKEFIEEESMWMVRVDAIKERFLIITPLYMQQTPEQVRKQKSEMLANLPFVRKEQSRKRKPKFKAPKYE